MLLLVDDDDVKKGSSPCLHEHAIGPYPELDESSPSPSILFLGYPF
jgi:hypothetical protein